MRVARLLKDALREKDAEIARLSLELEKANRRIQEDREAYFRDRRYFERRMSPVHFSIDRGNYEEMIQLVGPHNEQAVRDALERAP